jgi:hypothetical protein
MSRYVCRGCFRAYAEYVNGCVWCWDDGLTIDENRAKYPDRKVVRESEVTA